SIHNFCNVDLSAFYLDIIKDRLYVSRANSVTRRAAQTTIYYVLDYIVRLMAPILPFTMDEVWRHMVKGDLQREESVHLASFPVVKKEWLDDGLEERWVALLRVKVEVAKALESARKEKVIGHSLDARVAIIPPDGFMAFLKGYEDTLREILIVSRLDVEDARNLEGKVEGEGFIAFESQEVASLKVWVSHAEGKKCERCWHYSEDVGMNTEYPMVCGRCVSVVSSQ
ncbi:MAG: class I tRNA ligase family protein, partial [Deltaproteobacteria bacterium]|nr:class I tRNA ligase family protein [Deltaproteobacteria bacterium]